jgi:hypothetical protein
VFAQFGFQGRARADLVAALEGALAIKFQERESSYLGEYELYPPHPRSRDDDEKPELKLRDNIVPLDGGPAFREHPEFSVVLEVSSSSAEQLNQLQQLVCGQLNGQPF